MPSRGDPGPIGRSRQRRLNQRNQLPALDRENLGSAVYLALSEKLVKGHFQPNDRLRIRELAEQLGTSVTPVRDAVLRLVQDRALVMRSPRDIRVPILSSPEYLEIRTIRMNLEGLAAETAARFVDEATLDGLRAIIAANEVAIESGDAGTATELNQVFHFRLAEVARMPVLRRILQRLWLQMGPLIAEMYLTSGREVLAQHHVLVDALARGDAASAAAAIRRDIMEGGAPILARIRAIEDGAPGDDEPVVPLDRPHAADTV